MPAEFRRLILVVLLAWAALVIILSFVHRAVGPSPGAGMPEIPVYPGAHNKQVQGGPELRFQRIIYTVNLQPPAQELIDFYNRAMVEAGWHRWKNTRPPKWQTMSGEHGKISRLIVQWLDQQELWQCDLVLLWSPHEGGVTRGPEMGEMSVTCTASRTILVPQDSK